MAREKEKEKVVEENKDNPYYWVHDDVRTRSSSFVDADSMCELRGLKVVKEGSGAVVELLHCSGEDRVYKRRGDWPYFYFYTPCLIELRVKFPFSTFECDVLTQLNCAPSQLHPNSGSEGVVVRSVEVESPFYMDDKLIERFLLYWCSESCQILEAIEWSEEEEWLLDYLVESFADGECGRFPFLDPSRFKSFLKKKEKITDASETVKEGGDAAQSVDQPVSSFKRKMDDTEKSLEVIFEGDREAVGAGKSVFDRQKRLHGFILVTSSYSLWSDQFPFAELSDKVSQYPGDMLMTRWIGMEGLGKFIQVTVDRIAESERTYKERIAELKKSLK
ncbi:uncharacterized protein DS421_13g407940 [Arachis hypogaea]|nr:uncharacterized protein DS421_13g407940 [Arachis hypogaea]